MVELLIRSSGLGTTTLQYRRKPQQCPACKTESLFRYPQKNWLFCHHCHHADILDRSRKNQVQESKVQLWKFFLRLRTWFNTMSVSSALLRTLNIPAHSEDPRRTLVFNQFLGYCPRLEFLRETCYDLRFQLHGASDVHWSQPGLVLPIHVVPGRLSGFLIAEAQNNTLLSFSHRSRAPEGRILLRLSTKARAITWPDVLSMYDDAYLAAMRHPHYTLACYPVHHTQQVFDPPPRRLAETAFCLKPLSKKKPSLRFRFDHRPLPLRFWQTTST